LFEFKFSIRQFDLVLKELADQLNTEVKDDRITLNGYPARGNINHVVLPNKLDTLIMNFDLKEGVDHQAVMGRDQYVLVAKGKNLWVKNPAEEGKVLESMKRANDLVVKGASAKGNATSDRYSLKGFGDALDRVQKECR